MARPKKLSLDYFPVDVGLLANAKMMLAVNDAGANAFAAYIGMLGAIYSHSYWLPADDPRIQVLPSRMHMPLDDFNEACEALFAWGLLDKVEAQGEAELKLCPGGVAITSAGLQEQYFNAKKSEPKPGMPFLLLDVAASEVNGGF